MRPNATAWMPKNCKRRWQKNLQRNKRKRRKRESSRKATRRPRPILINAHFLWNWSPAKRCQRSTKTATVEAFFGSAQPGTIVLLAQCAQASTSSNGEACQTLSPASHANWERVRPSNLFSIHLHLPCRSQLRLLWISSSHRCLSPAVPTFTKLGMH